MPQTEQIIFASTFLGHLYINYIISDQQIEGKIETQ